MAALLLLGLPAFPDEATARAQIGRLGLLARLTVEGHDLARLMCQAMCLLRPLAVTLGPLVIRDLPPTVVADGARHTWPSYSRTLEEVVVGHRPPPDVVAAAVPTVVAHGREDRVAPVALAEAWAAAARQRGAPVTLRLLEGDHHLAGAPAQGGGGGPDLPPVPLAQGRRGGRGCGVIGRAGPHLRDAAVAG